MMRGHAEKLLALDGLRVWSSAAMVHHSIQYICKRPMTLSGIEMEDPLWGCYLAYSPSYVMRTLPNEPVHGLHGLLR